MYDSESVLIVDVDQPVANVIDTGGVPTRDLMTIQIHDTSMKGEWRVVGIWGERMYGQDRVRLHVKRIGPE